MEELKKLYSNLVNTGKDEPVRVALDALLLAPNHIDLQINVLGIAHQAKWLPNRKKVLWRGFPINSELWISRCLARITETGNDANALCALLNTNVLAVAKAVQTYSPDLVMVWDVKGAEFCGFGLANYRGDEFDRYFYIGWKPGYDTVHRLEFIPRIEAPLGQGTQRLDKIIGQCEIIGGFWAELPYGFGYWASRREFATSATTLEPLGCAEIVLSQLGYESLQ